MPHFARLIPSPTAKQPMTASAPARPQPRRAGTPRDARWHALQLRAAKIAEPAPAPSAPSRSPLPAALKAGVERLSGIAMDDVRVHRNSAEPARLGALAYAHGSDIHLGPGQEQHLPHEAWHVVQQKQGRVAPTAQLKAGVAVNDDQALEREADAMGTRALATGAETPLQARTSVSPSPPAAGVVQRLKVMGTQVASIVSADTHAKHVKATNQQAAAAKDNYGSTTYVTSDATITAVLDPINWDFRAVQSTYKNFYRNVTVSVYAKTGEQDAGKPVARTINEQSTRCQIGVTKSRSGIIRVTHFQSA